MGVTLVALHLVQGVVCRHISVGFLLFLFDLIGIARPPFVNKTTEVCAFFVPVCRECVYLEKWSVPKSQY